MNTFILTQRGIADITKIFGVFRTEQQARDEFDAMYAEELAKGENDYMNNFDGYHTYHILIYPTSVRLTNDEVEEIDLPYKSLGRDYI